MKERSTIDYIDGGHADRVAIELPIQFGQHQAHCGSGTVLVRIIDMVCRAGAAQVLVHHVGEYLVVGARRARWSSSPWSRPVCHYRVFPVGQAIGGCLAFEIAVIAEVSVP